MARAELLAERGVSTLDMSSAEMIQPTSPSEGWAAAAQRQLSSGLYGGRDILEQEASEIDDSDGLKSRDGLSARLGEGFLVGRPGC